MACVPICCDHRGGDSSTTVNTLVQSVPDDPRAVVISPAEEAPAVVHSENKTETSRSVKAVLGIAMGQPLKALGMAKSAKENTISAGLWEPESLPAVSTIRVMMMTPFTSVMPAMAIVVLALIPSVRNDDEYDLVFYILSIIVVSVLTALMVAASYIFLSRKAINRNEDNTVALEGSRYVVHDATSGLKAPDTNKFTNYFVNRIYQSVRLLPELLVACLDIQTAVEIEKKEGDSDDPVEKILMGIELAILFGVHIEALIGAYKPQYSPFYLFSHWIATQVYGAKENIPFVPIEKTSQEIQLLMPLMVTLPATVVFLIHVIYDVRETSTWLLPILAFAFSLLMIQFIAVFGA